ncbi:zinc transporter ZntB [Photobacterium phosphoreum]|uniref:Zinc transporter ZntB n=2 Tax=Photobacterium TaxID=657 RepID=A0A2N4UNM7_9GAMM|nr:MULTISPECIES: zinc transporter ZntB [Photobacterium]KAE8175753.1 zinc transporter ZntB [Photobacterium carnosum]MBY3790691.1 zinc transporter ZntB [Photobacterium carnosum]MCD9465137.1 zinc transporter ZntB [Photobacterium phosphoreum]MCD9472650.1 zinc transporter ZntB [Photobacterium phosphoreum]MCD9476643.1 zinc transporter ZntB [Photobacterium phosphoreum]
MTTNKKPTGLIHSIVLDCEGGMRQLDWNEIPHTKDNLWLHFDYTEQEVHQWFKEHSGLNEIAQEVLLSDDSRPHIIRQHDNLLAVFRGINLNPKSSPEDMVSLRIWTNGRILISTRKRRLLSTGDIIECLTEGNGPINIPLLFISWLDQIVKRMADTIDNLEDNLLAQEYLLEDEDLGSIRAELLKIRKQSIGIRRYLTPQREAMNKLINEPLTWLHEMYRLNLITIADRQIKHIEDIDALRERSGMVQDEINNLMSEKMNHRSYVLTIIAAIFLPLGFFTGLMGINVGGMPGVDNINAFWIVVFICFSLCFGLLATFFLKKWI